ncbi:MAG: butyrate kinase [Planctomycetota bacterium]
MTTTFVVRKKNVLILVINPGSTSTKLAVFRGGRCLFAESLFHTRAELAPFKRIADQYSFRKNMIQACLKQKSYEAADFDAIAARGGLTKPIDGGVYAINEQMIADLNSAKWGEHPCNLAAPLAAELAGIGGCPAFILDPPIVDELWDIARISGYPDIPRISKFHALSQKAAARHAAKALKVRYEAANFVVAHIGGGISVGAHHKGKVVDVNSALDGEGPFSPERAGSLPAGDLARLCFSGKFKLDEILRIISRAGGLVAHLGTNDCREVEKRIVQGDKKAAIIYEAMAYQIAKSIGAAATVLSGKVNAVVLTGGLANSKKMVRLIKKYAAFIAPFKVYPKMEEMSALAAGALAALNGAIKVKEYR